MRIDRHSLLLAAAMTAGLIGAAIKAVPGVPSSPTAALISPEIAEPTGSTAVSNRGPYEVTKYVARRCLGEILVLPLHRNGEAADLLPGVEGFSLDGRITSGFPAATYTFARVMAFAGLRDVEPQVFAFAETGNCNLASRLGVGPSE